MQHRTQQLFNGLGCGHPLPFSSCCPCSFKGGRSSRSSARMKRLLHRLHWWILCLFIIIHTNLPSESSIKRHLTASI